MFPTKLPNQPPNSWSISLGISLKPKAQPATEARIRWTVCLAYSKGKGHVLSFYYYFLWDELRSHASFWSMFLASTTYIVLTHEQFQLCVFSSWSVECHARWDSDLTTATLVLVASRNRWLDKLFGGCLFLHPGFRTVSFMDAEAHAARLLVLLLSSREENEWLKLFQRKRSTWLLSFVACRCWGQAKLFFCW